MKFKVGQRVWAIEENQFVEIVGEKRLTDYGERYPVYNKEIDLLYKHDYQLHQTSDNMFEELGFEKIKEDSEYVIYNYHNYEGGFITELRIDKVKNKYKLTNFTNNNRAFSVWSDTNLHQAIHQKMIELGWIKGGRGNLK